MLEVTQADRELFITISNADGQMAERILCGQAFTWEVEQIARHRQSAAEYWYRQGNDDGYQTTVEAIGEWLRDQYSGRLQSPIFLADAIEAGEPFK